MMSVSPGSRRASWLSGLGAEREVLGAQLSRAGAGTEQQSEPVPGVDVLEVPVLGPEPGGEHRGEGARDVEVVLESLGRPAYRLHQGVGARGDPHRGAETGGDHPRRETLAHDVGDRDLEHRVVEQVPVVVVAADVERRLAAPGDVVAEHVRGLLGEQPVLDLGGLDGVCVGGQLCLDPAREVVEECGVAVAQTARLVVEQAERPDDLAARTGERPRCVEDDAGVAGDERVVGPLGVLACV
jgi:hypothetical protein